MTFYNLQHLTQEADQRVIGPIQDDEALFLYSVIRGMRIKTVLEIGGLNGYSSKNFLEAVGSDGKVFTCDINPVPVLADNHIFLHKNAVHITPEDFNFEEIEMLFFDCHDYDVQMSVFNNLLSCGSINDNTVISLHDTNTHVQNFTNWSKLTDQGWVHQSVERRMVNDLVELGWSPFCLHTKPCKHGDSLPFRHGITIMTKFKHLLT